MTIIDTPLTGYHCNLFLRLSSYAFYQFNSQYRKYVCAQSTNFSELQLTQIKATKVLRVNLLPRRLFLCLLQLFLLSSFCNREVHHQVCMHLLFKF